MSHSPLIPNEAKDSCPINDLADAVLAKIFKCLPPLERLLVSEVCWRWYEISALVWRDVTELDLGPIPRKHIGAVLCQCPNLQSVFAAEKFFGLKDLAGLPNQPKLSSVRLFSCELELANVTDIVENIFSNKLEHAAWNELVLHNTIIKPLDNEPIDVMFNAANLPTTLTHLQLSGLRIMQFEEAGQSSVLFLDPIERLENLECFILQVSPEGSDCGEGFDVIGEALFDDDDEVEVVVFDKLCYLKNLRELCISSFHISGHGLGHLFASLPKLEVLFICSPSVFALEDLAELITSTSLLRILVLAGDIDYWREEPVEVPSRKRFPRGFGADPLPLLHIFVGKSVHQHLRFAESSSDAAIVHLITEPMPQFLKREEIAATFEGVWVAEKIIEAASFGGRLWNYNHDVDARRADVLGNVKVLNLYQMVTTVRKPKRRYSA